jgi:hypothetical protein
MFNPSALVDTVSLPFLRKRGKGGVHLFSGSQNILDSPCEIVTVSDLPFPVLSG